MLNQSTARFNSHDRRRLIGMRVYQERASRRLTQAEISRKIASVYGPANAISQERLSKIERGKAKYVDVIELGFIADSMNLPITQFTNP